jgi:hypothetical protein
MAVPNAQHMGDDAVHGAGPHELGGGLLKQGALCTTKRGAYIVSARTTEQIVNKVTPRLRCLRCERLLSSAIFAQPLPPLYPPAKGHT